MDSVACEFAEIAGVDLTGLSPSRCMGAALMSGASDLPLVLLNVARAAALQGYNEATETFRSWTTTGGASSFRAAKRAAAGQFPALDPVHEGAEIGTAVFAAGAGETVRLRSYAKLFLVSRAALLADDLDEVSRVPRLAGRAAARAVGDLAYAAVTTSPTMADGVALFHADHGNLLAGAAISAGSIAAMAAAISAQTVDGAPTRQRLRFLLVPVALEFAAHAALAAIFGGAPPTIEVVADHRLDESSETAWYGAIDPRGGDAVELSYLNGAAAPTVEISRKFDTDGALFRVLIDACATPLDWRGLAKNPGA